MHPPEQLPHILKDLALDAATCRARFYRASQLVYLRTLTSSAGAWKGHNRYTTPELSQAYYLADGPDQAMLEATRQQLDAFATNPVPGFVIFPVEVRLRRVLDLTDENLYAPLGTTLAELTGDWRAERRRRLPVTSQLLGAAAFHAGFEGILYPSAPNPQRRNLVVFTEKLSDVAQQLRFEIDPVVREFVEWHAQRQQS